MTSSQENVDASIIPLEDNETPVDCAKRLSRRLSEYEATSVETAGRANQIRKERDAERARNQKLQKEIEKLSNQLLRERTRSASLVREVKLLQNERDDELKTDSGNPESSSSISNCVFTDENLARKVKDLQKILEERIKEEEKKIANDTADIHVHNKMAALAMLYQSVQSYLELGNDHEDALDGRVDTLDAVGTLVDGLKTTHEYLVEKRNAKNGKRQVSMWMKILVYLGPILLSALCYLAFTSVKK